MKTKILKKTVSTVLVILLVLSTVFVAGSFTASAETSGSCGTNVTWQYNTFTKTLTVSGTGEMWNYDNYETYVPWLDYIDSITSVVINNGVTSIADSAFKNCSELTNITIPNSITRIGDWAFYDCNGLTSITIPNSVTSIGDCAFWHGSGLKSIIIGSGVTSIGEGAFYFCNGLTSITVNNGNTNYHSAGNCLIETQSKTLILGSNNSVIPNDGSVTSIDDLAFYDCIGLKSITIPNSVTSIGDWAFYGCQGLTSITIPGSVTSIGAGVFSGCDNLDYNTYSNAKYLGDDQNPYLVLVGANSTDITSCSINPNTKIIHSDAFCYCSGLTGITIPNGVTSIGNHAFCYCDGLIDITIPESVTSIGEYAFAVCSGLTSVIIGNGVISIGDEAFYDCTGLRSVTIGNNVKNIGYYAFYNTGLTSVIIPEGVEIICEMAFCCCDNLTSVTIPDSIIRVDSAFEDCGNLSFNSYDNAKYLGNSNNPYVALIKPASNSISSCNIHKNTKVIGGMAFYFCNGLTSITLPDSVTNIGVWAFYNCGGLTNITLYNGVKTIGEEAFHDCGALSKVTYNGNAYEWSNIEMDTGNECLLNAQREYKSSVPNFPDVNYNDWYGPSVAYAVSAGIFKGYANGTFGVSNNIQRQDFIITLARYSGEDYESYTSSGQFSDVSNGAYYTSAVIWGSTKGIVSGYENGSFGVGNNVTREQLVLFLYRYANYKGYDTSVTTDASYWQSKYSDFAEVSTWARDAVIWALEKGVISGKQGKYIAPQGNAQRCEVAAIFYNINQKNVFGN